MTTTDPIVHPEGGFLLETTSIPQGFLRRLESDGTLFLASRSAEGAYVEPRVPIFQVLTRFALAGIEVRGVVTACICHRGRRITRSAAETHRRLRSPRAAEWLPMLPAA